MFVNNFDETERHGKYRLCTNIHLVICSVMFAVYFLMPIVFAGLLLSYLLYLPITVTCIELCCGPSVQRYLPASLRSTLYIIRDSVFTFPYLAPC